MSLIGHVQGGHVHNRRAQVLSSHLAELIPPGAQALDVGFPQISPPRCRSCVQFAGAWPQLAPPPRLLESFQERTLTIIREGRRRRCQLTLLSTLHQRILALLDFPVDISTRLCADFWKPP
jgi:hypothetical protein